MLGRNSCVLKNVRRIQSCNRSWTLFFRDGAKKDTEFTIWPDGHALHGFMSSTPWLHPIPE